MAAAGKRDFRTRPSVVMLNRKVTRQSLKYRSDTVDKPRSVCYHRSCRFWPQDCRRAYDALCLRHEAGVLGYGAPMTLKLIDKRRDQTL